MPVSDQRARKVMAVMENAIIRTRGRSLREVTACNARFGRARDLLLHGEMQTFSRRGLVILPEEMDALREDAVQELRAVCAVCGLCARKGLKPP